MPGPPPKPRNLKVLEGTFRSDRDRGAPNPRAGKPTRPKIVREDPVAKKEWSRLLKAGAAVITPSDGGMLEAAALAYSTWQRAEQALSEHGGLTYTTETQSGSKMIRPHPAVAIAAEAWRRYTAALAHFGLSPSTRSKAPPAAAPEDKKPNPEEAFRV